MSAVTETDPGPSEPNPGPTKPNPGQEAASREAAGREGTSREAAGRAGATLPRIRARLRPRASARAWTVGWPAGLAQAIGVALLLITEFVRQDVAALGERVRPGVELPHYAADFPHLQATLGVQWWFRLLGEARDAMSFGEPRAALWAAVCAALVVRLNKEGPPRTQCFLSLAGALYCALAALSAIPYLALPGFALPFVLVLGAVAVVGATPGWRRRVLG